MRRREFISLFGGMAAAWSLAAQAQESATMGTTKATTAVLPQIEVARVKPVDTMPPNLRLSDSLIDLMEDFIAKKFTVQVYCQGISQKTATGSAGPLALSPSDVADFGTKFDAEATPGRGSTRP